MTVSDLESRLQERVEACALRIVAMKKGGDPAWRRKARLIGQYVRLMDAAWVGNDRARLLVLLDTPPKETLE
jgi:hypothetical protein